MLDHIRNTAGLVLLTLIGTFASAATPAMKSAHPERVSVLIVTGVDHPAHDWKAKSAALVEILELDPRLSVSIAEDPEYLASDEIFKHDVILLNFYSPRKNYPGAKSRKNLRRFVHDKGKGLFVLHFACGAFPDWEEYVKMAGRIWDCKNTHDQRRPFDVEVTDPSHPITKGLKTLKADDELYTCLTGETPVHQLAKARSRKTDSDHPMAFTLSYGMGRVFHTPLGHDVRSLRMPDVANMIRRGCLWAGGIDPTVPAEPTFVPAERFSLPDDLEVTIWARTPLFHNPVNMDFDAQGRLWLMGYGNLGYASNDGARTWRADQRPGQPSQVAHWRQKDPGIIPAGDVYGGGAPTDIAFYENGALPEKYRGLVLSAEAGRNIVLGYLPQTEGAGFTMDRFDFFTSNPDKVFEGSDFARGKNRGKASDLNRYFRPSDVMVGPDGAIYVADWFDNRSTSIWRDHQLAAKPTARSPRTPSLPAFDPSHATTLPPANKISALSADAKRGKKIFFGKGTCHACHRAQQEGADLGPDLTGVSTLFDKKVIIDAILNPSASIALGYDSTVFTTQDKKTVTGYVLSAGNPVLIKDLAGNRFSIEAKDIISNAKLKTSVMPAASTMGLSAQKLADGVEFPISIRPRN